MWTVRGARCAPPYRGAETVVDVDDRDAGRTAIEHGEEGCDAAEASAVPHARRYRNHRPRYQSSHDGRQGAVHPGHDDHDRGGGELFTRGEQAVDPRHADVRESRHRAPGGIRRFGRLLRDRQVTRARGDDQDGAVRASPLHRR
jgi:hypothetical protein